MKYQLERMPTTDEELYHLVWTMWGVRIPSVAVCPDHVAPFTAFADAFFARSPVSIWKASRGFGGKSRTLAYLALTELAVLGAEISLLGGSGAQSVNIHDAMRDGWNSDLAPHELVKSETNVSTTLRNGGKIRALMASQRSVRGPHPQRLRLDEIDEMEESILDGALGQPMAKRNARTGVYIDTSTVMSSTHQYADKTMTAMLNRAATNGWPVFQWCWRETSNPKDGWLTTKAIERKRAEVSAQMWSVEYDLQEPAIGNRAFDTQSVEQMFSMPYTGSLEAQSITDEEWTFQEPDKHGDYVTAADWAQTQDRTVISTWRTNCQPWELVYYFRGYRRPYPQMVKKFNDAMTKYHSDGVHDATGLGNVVKDYIDGSVENFVMAGLARKDMLSEYVAAVERGEFSAPPISSAFSEHKYASVEDLYNTGQQYHLPDTVCSFALAWHRSGRKAAPVGYPIELNREGESPWVWHRESMFDSLTV